jgi:hypothetical protein
MPSLAGRTLIRRAIPSLAALVVSMAANAQPCYPGPRLYDIDRAAYEAQARRVFAPNGVEHAAHHGYQLDHVVPRCLAVGNYDGDDNLQPQPLTEARVKDQMEREVCRRVCDHHSLGLADGVALFRDWQTGYWRIFGHPPTIPHDWLARVARIDGQSGYQSNLGGPLNGDHVNPQRRQRP